MDKQKYEDNRVIFNELITANIPKFSTLIPALMRYRVSHIGLELKNFNHHINNKEIFDACLQEDINKRLSESYIEYFQYMFGYRSGNRLDKNVTYSKILSVEYYFFCKHKILKSSVNPIDNLTERESFLSQYPTAYFFYYRIHSKYFSCLGSNIKKGTLSKSESDKHNNLFKKTLLNIIEESILSKEPLEPFSLKKYFDAHKFTEIIDSFYPTNTEI